jgi:hypothetical protein
MERDEGKGMWKGWMDEKRGGRGVAALTEPEQIPRRDVPLHDLLEEVVERLVGVRDEQRPLPGAVVVEHVHDLEGRGEGGGEVGGDGRWGSRGAKEAACSL